MRGWYVATCKCSPISCNWEYDQPTSFSIQISLEVQRTQEFQGYRAREAWEFSGPLSRSLEGCWGQESQRAPWLQRGPGSPGRHRVQSNQVYRAQIYTDLVKFYEFLDIFLCTFWYISVKWNIKLFPLEYKLLRTYSTSLPKRCEQTNVIHLKNRMYCSTVLQFIGGRTENFTVLSSKCLKSGH